MQIEEYLKQHQPICYRVFGNSLQDGRLNHAYLLAGENGIPLKEIAIYLAKSIVCLHPNPLADNTCVNCRRIDDGNYVDLMILDGEEESIKKADVVEVTASFSKTSVESKGVMIYIINLAERMTPEATNSLLKFLEEPTSNTYAILTTLNSSRILPTIVSRCELIRLNAVARKDVLEGSRNLNLDEKKAELLSFFYAVPELIKEKIENGDADELVALLEDIVYSLGSGGRKAVFLFQSKIAPKCNTKARAGILIDLLVVIFRELLNLSNGFNPTLPSYADLLNPLLKNTKNLDKKLDFVLKVKSELETNINVSLLLDHVIITLFKEENS